MANTLKNVRFCEPEITEYELVMFTVSWRRAQHHTPGLGEEEMAEFDADLQERQVQKLMSKRAHRLLALGRAAEMRASVVSYLQQGSASRLPDIVVPRRTERSPVLPTSRASRSQRPAPRARERNISAENHNATLTPQAHAAHTKRDVDPTKGGTAWQSEPASLADEACLGTVSFAASGDSVECEGDASVLAREVIEPRCTSKNPCSYLTAWTSDATKIANIDHERSSNTDQQVHAALQRHVRTPIPEGPSENSAKTKSKGQLPFSPVPPTEHLRARPSHRRFKRGGSPQSSSELVEDSGPVKEHLETSTPFLQQLHDQRLLADHEYDAVWPDANVFEETQTRCADLAQSASSI
eukprot:TRINITY_DN3028_c2_g5_i1.p1 TRINITY_DN3028_c2_g5~~TRINITY_DN3028_c2_g5_i1.p1  ORF type:complete len:354 (-),score=37.63 TRINITY_DN3028_c2_g5_i1:421-1482(-)